jgi:hypothetical protein
MPAQDGAWLHDDQGAAPVRPRLGEQDPKESIAPTNVRTFVAGQRGQLLTERHVLQRQRTVSAAHQSDESKK